MRKTINARWWAAALLFSGSSLFAQAAPDPFRTGEGTHLYLRCNTTSWDVNDDSRLKPGALGFLRELSFEVKETWMTEGGDDCVLTETPKLNAWGDWQNYYGGQLSFLKVPDSARLRRQTDANDSVNFKLRFPSLGRYRFILNTRDGYFSIRKDLPPQAGDVAWTLPGNMLSDDFGHLFLVNYYPQNSLSLVDGKTGLPQWTYSASESISLYGNCSTTDMAFVTRPGRVAALSLQTGKEIWSTDLNGGLQDTYGYLNCFAKHDEIYLSYGGDRSTLVSLQRRTGQMRWSWTAPAFAAIMGVDANRIFINTYQEAKTSLIALNKADGRELWQVNPEAGYFSQSEDGGLFWVDGNRLSAIAADSGQTLWKYKGQPNDAIWLSFEQNGLYVHEKSRISAIDKKSGRAIWVYDYSAFAEQYPYTQILKAGVVIVRINDYNNNSSRQIALNSWTGKVLWERVDPTTNGFFSEDNQSGTWLISGKTMRAIDPWTGQTRWSFTLSSQLPMENIMNVLEHDGSTVYVSYGLIGGKYPPMGVLALNATDGALKWRTWLESSVYRVGGDNGILILNAGYYGSTKALKK